MRAKREKTIDQWCPHFDGGHPSFIKTNSKSSLGCSECIKHNQVTTDNVTGRFVSACPYEREESDANEQKPQ